MSARHSRKGFSLIELMIAMALGLMLIGGAVTVFGGTLRSAGLNQAIAALQSGGRFALDAMVFDLRAAGYRGCAADEDSTLNVTAPDASPELLQRGAVGGARVESTGWVPAAPAGFVAATGVGAPIEGGDALFVQYAAAPGARLAASMASTGSAITVDALPPGIAAGKLAVVSDCLTADLFEVGAVATVAGTGSVQPASPLGRRYTISASFPESVRLLPFVGAIYYVGDTTRNTSSGDAVHALYLQTWPFDATSEPVELLEGVELLQLRFGVDDGAGGLRLRRPDAGPFDAADIERVQVELLVASGSRLLDGDPVREFELAGRIVGPRTAATAPGTPAYANDRRLRASYGTTVRLRNRNPERLIP